MRSPWGICFSEEFERSHRKLRKRHPASCGQAVIRAQRFLDAWLNNPLLQPGFNLPGWIHVEGRGVLAVDQGTASNLAVVRLYFYLEQAERRMWLLRLGDKSTQYADIAYCHSWVSELESGDEHESR